ncbi:glycosylphosphatidylinositol anchor biosynthesis [Coniosporium apollinis]|uniref:Mannosyltransferase n=1 Tax=Coniosporium apollinis TaxID=61459 RepID=A0ABQ9NV52_9PEZI|nr:glycosylphosphatidylinositol anchor biosynthesis [Coniosporium apollinis]
MLPDFVFSTCVLAFSALCDRLYYHTWTLPQLQFLHFNLAQDLAVFYGRNRPDYYLTEGLPLLLTTALPFAVLGLSRALLGRVDLEGKSSKPEVPPGPVLKVIAWTVVIVIAVLSMVSHKEVRFIYPLLPILNILSAGPLVSLFTPQTASRKAILALLVFINIIIAGYTTQIHQRGVIDVLHYLRHEHEQSPQQRMSAGFFMPCHSTPWRSHLAYPEIEAWALTCEPPIGVPLAERDRYLDEADQFYLDPTAWMEMNLDSGLKDDKQGDWRNVTEGQKRGWPQYLIFFAQLEDAVKEATRDLAYQESWRGFNSHWHDDWRRRGDVVVYKKIQDAEPVQ